jgi:dolichyl-phosphate-mannose-protein mannosyltransferase
VFPGAPCGAYGVTYAPRMRERVPAWVVPTVVTAAAAAVLVVRLGVPDTLVFDEVYYVEDARSVLDVGVENVFTVHPPLGKWLIAAGIGAFGDGPFGWRAAGALVGTVTVLLTVLVTRRLTGRPGLAALAGGLLALDGVFVVQARTAMLDVHLTGLVMLGAYLLVADRQRAGGGGPLSRWPLGLAGAAFGAAIATKWSGVLALVAAAALAGVWEHARRRRVGAAVGAVVAGLVVPAALAYVLTWSPWLLQFEGTVTAEAICAEQADGPCHVGATDRVAALLRHHADVLRFHLELDADHPYQAPATTWPVQTRPVVFHWESCPPEQDPAECTVAPGHAAEVVGLGNLALWWTTLGLLPVLVAGAVRRDHRSSLPLVFLAAQFLPWLVVARPVFSFYAVPLVPFLSVGLAVACGELDRGHRWAATLGGTLAGGGVGALVGSAVDTDAYGIGLAAALAALAGAAAGAVLDDRRGGRRRTSIRPVGSYVAGAVAVLGIAAAVYFAPVWLAIELPEEAIRARWWLPGWV